jgi:hypothetical protein
VTVCQIRTARQELGNRGELLGIKTLQQRGHIVSYGAEHVLDLSHPLEHRVEDPLTPVVWVRLTPQISRPLQPRDYTRNRAGGQVRDRGQVAAGQRPALAQQVKALVIRWTQTQSLGDRLVKQHGRNAVSAHQPPDDLIGQLTLSFPSGSAHRVCS